VLKLPAATAVSTMSSVEAGVEPALVLDESSELEQPITRPPRRIKINNVVFLKLVLTISASYAGLSRLKT
jgi:hypothetical protein